MAYKDTLQIYDDLLAGGCTESQARAQAQQLGSVGVVLNEFKIEFIDFRHEIKTEINEIKHEIKSDMSGIDKNLTWIKWIGATIILPIIVLLIKAFC